MNGFFSRSVVAVGLVLGLAGPADAEITVIASIKPVHSLVAGVMAGVAEPHLLIDSGTPHSYALRPSDARALDRADLIVWMGPDLEVFLESPLHGLAGKAEHLALGEIQDLAVRPGLDPGLGKERERDNSVDGHDHGVDGHDHGDVDTHLWLSPSNAKIFVAAIAEALAGIDPDNARHYRANADHSVVRLDRLIETTRAELAPHRGKPFLVFHDAYRSFQQDFEIDGIGAVALNPQSRAGARHIADLREALRDAGPACMFSEPQFEPTLLATLAEGLPVETGLLDPLGADLEAGPDLYFMLIGGLSTGLSGCLSRLP